MRRLRGNGVVALVADRDISGKGVEVEFFGEKTTMPAGSVALADRTGAVLLPVGCYFAEGRGHEFVIESPVVLPEVGKRSDRIAAGTQLLAHRLEAIIRRAPEQWHLFQPNWPSDREPA
jgi:KDO2-lipid IV(A) lauroyltransferase